MVYCYQGRRRAEKEKKGGAPNGMRDPFSDTEEDVERIAKQFEQKYVSTKCTYLVIKNHVINSWFFWESLKVLSWDP